MIFKNNKKKIKSYTEYGHACWFFCHLLNSPFYQSYGGLFN